MINYSLSNHRDLKDCSCKNSRYRSV